MIKLTPAQRRDLEIFARKAMRPSSGPRSSWGASKTGARLASLGLVEACGGYDYTARRPRIHVVRVTEYRITQAGRDWLAAYRDGLLRPEDT